jgi:hypothetical protein
MLTQLQDPWATTGLDGMGQRKFPQFPLPEPIQQREALRQDRDIQSATADAPRGEKRRFSLPNPLPSAAQSLSIFQVALEEGHTARPDDASSRLFTSSPTHRSHKVGPGIFRRPTSQTDHRGF